MTERGVTSRRLTPASHFGRPRIIGSEDVKPRGSRCLWMTCYPQFTCPGPRSELRLQSFRARSPLFFDNVQVRVGHPPSLTEEDTRHESPERERPKNHLIYEVHACRF